MTENDYKVDSKEEHPLLPIWNAFPRTLHNTSHNIVMPVSVEQFIGEMFALGEFYYYTLNVFDSTIINPQPNILKMHGLKKYPQYLKEIIDLIHPEDIAFVRDAERMTIIKMQEIGFEHQQNLKCSYCFRMKTENGNYEMFHHQSLHIAKDGDGKLLQAVNIHTNINHLTQQNPYTVTVMGIGGRNDFHQMQYGNTTKKEYFQAQLTKREIEILSLLAVGKSAKQISEQLNLSYHTVTTHRKNIFQKTGCTKISELIKRSIEYGLI